MKYKDIIVVTRTDHVPTEGQVRNDMKSEVINE